MRVALDSTHETRGKGVVSEKPISAPARGSLGEVQDGILDADFCLDIGGNRII